MKRLAALWMLIRTDIGQFWRALRHPDAPAWLKIASAGLLLYVVSPVDLVPDFLPLLGITDDLVLVPLAIRWMLSRLPTHLRTTGGFATRAASGRPHDGSA